LSVDIRHHIPVAVSSSRDCKAGYLCLTSDSQFWDDMIVFVQYVLSDMTAFTGAISSSGLEMLASTFSNPF